MSCPNVLVLPVAVDDGLTVLFDGTIVVKRPEALRVDAYVEMTISEDGDTESEDVGVCSVATKENTLIFQHENIGENLDSNIFLALCPSMIFL